MKPGNLLIQGAKSGGKRKMRIRYTHIESVGVRFLFLYVIANQSADWCGNLPDIPGWLQTSGDSHASVRAGSE